MRFGYFNITMGKGRVSERQIYEDFLSDAALAEELNFDAVWLAEHHFNADFCLSPAPNLLLAAVAATTKRIKIGSCVNVLPMYNPVRIIEEIAELDLLSNGRFQWGIGRGIAGHEFEGYGIDPEQSLAMFREIHDAAVHAFATGDLAWHGERLTIPKKELVPSVVQRPHPPVWVSAQSPFSVDWAAEHGYPAMQVLETVDRGRAQLKRWQNAARAAGRAADDRGAIVPLRYVFVAETEAEVEAIGRPKIMEWLEDFFGIAAPRPTVRHTESYSYYQSPETSFRSQIGRMNFDELNEAGIIAVGTPKQVIRLLERQIEALELRYFIADFWRAGKARADRQKSMRLFAETVMPYFSDSRSRVAAE